jgi:RNA polymerase-binding transcription factor DksA
LIKGDCLVSLESNDRAGVRERLLARQQELRTRRERLEADRRREAEPLTADAPDRAIQRENDEVVDSIGAAVVAELAAVTAALVRLDSGRYGLCESCGSAIEAKRLAAVAHAARCQNCATQI